MPNTIFVGGSPAGVTKLPDTIASETITPGELLEYVPSGGDQGQFRRHTNAGFNAAPIIALEAETPSRTSSNAPIDTTYADGDAVQAAWGKSGEVYYMWLADGQEIVKGDFLECADNGHLRKHTPPVLDEGGTATVTIYAAAPRFVADEAKTTSGAVARLHARVL